MNHEEKKQMELLEQAIECFEQEIKLKDELIREQKKALYAQEEHIQKLTDLLNKIMQP